MKADRKTVECTILRAFNKTSLLAMLDSPLPGTPLTENSRLNWTNFVYVCSFLKRYWKNSKAGGICMAQIQEGRYSKSGCSEIVVFFSLHVTIYFKIGFREVELALNSLTGLGRFKKKKKMKITGCQKREELMRTHDFSQDLIRTQSSSKVNCK